MKTHALHLPSFPALLDWVEATPSDWPKGNRHTERTTAENRAFTGSPSLPAAIQTAREGWLEGARAFDEALQGLVEHQARGRMKRTAFDTDGDELDTDRLFARDPEPWAVYTRTTRTKRVHAIAVSAWCPWMITDAQRRAYYVGLAALVSGLEAAGDSVALSLVWGSYCGDVSAEVRATLKQAGEPLEPVALAFPLTHTASHRRILFAAAERLIPWHEGGERYSKNYGFAKTPAPFPGELVTPDLTLEAMEDYKKQGPEDYWASWWRTEAARAAAALA